MAHPQIDPFKHVPFVKRDFVLDQEPANFFGKGQKVNILSFVGHAGSVATIQLCKSSHRQYGNKKMLTVCQ